MLPKILENNLSVPVVGAPLFIISRPQLVIAQCKAGIVGSFPALNARPQELLSDWINQIKDELGQFKEENPDKPVAPFAVNQICHLSNDRLFKDVETCVKHEAPIIITSLRPPEDLVKAIHSYGGLVFHDVISTRHAQKAVEQGVDGLILVCAGAGGHAGALSPFALLRETREWYDGTILLSGSISDGFSVASAIAMGAGMDPENLPEADKTKMNFNSGGNASAKVWKDIYGSGQGINSIKDSPKVEDLVDEMKTEFQQAKREFSEKSNNY